MDPSIKTAVSRVCPGGHLKLLDPSMIQQLANGVKDLNLSKNPHSLVGA